MKTANGLQSKSNQHGCILPVPVESFDFAAFNQGDCYRAVNDKVFSENLTKVLYPNDEVIQGKNLRNENAPCSRQL